MLKPNQHPKLMKSKSKPEWDGTVNDLSVHKLSQEEIFQRKLDHLSKNTLPPTLNSNVISKNETIYDRLTKTRYGNKVKESDVKDRQVFLKNALTSDKELFELFKQSEKTLENVESYFGGSVRKYVAKPKITYAPQNRMNTNNSNCECLNDVEVSQSDVEDNDLLDQPSNSARNNLNRADDELTRFRNFLEAERNNDKEKSSDFTEKDTTSIRQKPLIEKVLYCQKSTQTDGLTDLELPTSLSSNVRQHQNDEDMAFILNYMAQIVEHNMVSKKDVLQQPESNVGTKVPDSLTKRPIVVNACDNFVKSIYQCYNENYLEIDKLKEESRQNKDLIDALTLELIKTGEKVKSLKSEVDKFTKSTAMTLSEIQGTLIKQIIHDNPSINHLKLNPGASTLSNRNGSNNANIHADGLSSDPDLDNISRQLNLLQNQRHNTQQRINNLDKLKNSMQIKSSRSDN